MASTPSFGNTNGVGDLDLGQKGSARAVAGDARYTLNVIVRPPKFLEIENRMPQQGFKTVDHVGFDGQAVRWEGWLAVKNDAVLAGILSDLSAAKTGLAITAGVYQPYDKSKVKATRLTNRTGRILGEKARVKDFGFPGEPRNISRAGSAMTIGLRMDVLFEIMG